MWKVRQWELFTDCKRCRTTGRNTDALLCSQDQVGPHKCVCDWAVKNGSFVISPSKCHTHCPGRIPMSLTRLTKWLGCITFTFVCICAHEKVFLQMLGADSGYLNEVRRKQGCGFCLFLHCMLGPLLFSLLSVNVKPPGCQALLFKSSATDTVDSAGHSGGWLGCPIR